jgi:hypothetical protein
MIALGLAIGAVLMVYAMVLYSPPYVTGSLPYLALSIAIIYYLIVRKILFGKNANKAKQTPS